MSFLLHQQSARATAQAVQAGELRAADIVDAALRRIETTDPQLGAFVETWGASARALAERIDGDRARGRTLGRLAGVPVAVKDNLAYAGHALGCASKILRGFRAPYTATVLERMLREDAIPIGRTNMDEFGMGSSTEHSCHGPTRNPFDAQRTPGGSSGGSAVAVAARQTPLALGSDTGGSIRQPAAMCGVLGLKPTYGRVPRHGLVAYASSLDTVGALAHDAGDLALWLAIASGVDPLDSTSLDAPPPGPELAAERGLAGLRIGVPAEYFGAGLDAEVEAGVRAALQRMESLGAKLVAVQLPATSHAIAAYYLIATAEASSNLARYDGVRYGLRVGADSVDALYRDTRSAGFGSEVKRRILLGTFCLSRGHHDAFYGQATKVRSLVRNDHLAVFAQCDLLAGPTSPVPAFPLGSRLDDPLAMYLCDVLTVGANLAGIPALSVPCGFTRSGLPIGLQLIAPALGEEVLLQTAGCLLQDRAALREPVP